MTFAQFVNVIFKYCCFSETDLLNYCFFLCDEDGSGWLSRDELEVRTAQSATAPRATILHHSTSRHRALTLTEASHCST